MRLPRVSPRDCTTTKIHNIRSRDQARLPVRRVSAVCVGALPSGTHMRRSLMKSQA